ncbi:MAG TPA: hypothetical protein VF637_06395 [Sphingomicrobium sp.]
MRLFIFNLIGLGLGPLVVGLLSNLFAAQAGPSAGLRWGLALASLGGFAAGGLFWIARNSIERDTELNQPV